MKEGWKKEKFEDVFDLQMGKTPSRDNPSYWDGTNTWVSISDMTDKKYISKSKEQISDIAVKDSGIKQVKKGTAIMSFKLSIGKTAIAEEDLFTNEAIMAFNVREGYGITPDYIYYYLRGYKWEGANKAVMGATLNKKTIASNYFSYPSLPEQERIVAELDCLSDIIEKQKQQLKELDNLAQSIFYTTFGDPISNNFGWEIKPLGDVCESELGKTLDAKRNTGELYPYLCSINVQWGHFDLSVVKEMKMEPKELERYTVRKGDLLICEGGDTGRSAVWNRDEVIYYQNALHRLRFKANTMLPLFCQYLMLELKNKGEIAKYSKGQTIKHLVKSALLSIKAICPPFDLQQEFVSKIEAIEQQKEIIKQSIAETETLFNSRMDYYFN